MVRDVAKTRSDLLAAATAEFSEYGLAGARVDRIARAAGVNKERIYGHFGSKEQLFEAVLADALNAAAADKPLQPGDSPGVYARRTFDFHRAHPTFLRLLQWEALGDPATPADSPERQAHYDRKIDAFRQAGLSDTDARVALYATLALTTFGAALPQLTDLILGDLDPQEQREAVVALVDRVVSLPVESADAETPDSLELQ